MMLDCAVAFFQPFCTGDTDAETAGFDSTTSPPSPPKHDPSMAIMAPKVPEHSVDACAVPSVRPSIFLQLPRSFS